MRPRTPHPLRDPACTLCDVIKYGYLQQIRLLIATGSDLECRDEFKRTPIILCALVEPEAWGIGTAMHLIENGVRIDRKDAFGRNVLHYACIYEREGLLRVILKAIDFDLNQSDKLGNTALHYTALSGNVTTTHIMAYHFKRYKINPSKTNKQGKTAMQEALRVGNDACAHAIEKEMMAGRPGSAMKDVRFADEVLLGLSPRKSRGSLMSHSSGSASRKQIYRPTSAAAILTRREEALGGKQFHRKERSRSNLSLPMAGQFRKSQNELDNQGIRREEDIIHCADDKNVRNNPDFVFKLMHLPYDSNEWSPLQGLNSTPKTTTSSWVESSTNSSQSQPTPVVWDWRRDLKRLFKVYESQCSTSWRPVQKSSTSGHTDEAGASDQADEDEKGKKVRRHSTSLRGKDQVPELRRRASFLKLRRQSSASLTKMAPLMDGSLDTSSESINSAASVSKKRGGQDLKDTTGHAGRCSLVCEIPAGQTTQQPERQ